MDLDTNERRDPTASFTGRTVAGRAFAGKQLRAGLSRVLIMGERIFHLRCGRRSLLQEAPHSARVSHFKQERDDLPSLLGG